MLAFDGFIFTFSTFYIIYNDDVLVLTVGCFSIINQIQLVVNYNMGISTIMVKAVFELYI